MSFRLRQSAFLELRQLNNTMGLGWLIAGLVAAAPLSLYLYTFRRTPHASIADIEADGGHVVVAQDGRLIEYFEFGADKDYKELMVFFHGYSLSGSSASMWSTYALPRGLKVVSISMPGWGGSSPYRGRSYFDAGRDAWLVLEHIGVPQDAPVHIVGTSFGAGNAAAMASIAPERVQSLSLLIPAMPSWQGHHEMFEGSSFMHWLLGQPFFDRIWQYYIAPKMDIPSVLEALAPADWAEFVAKQGPQVVAEMTHQLQRSTKYHHEGACDSMRLLRGDDPRYYSSIIGPLKQLGSRISVWYALHDQLAPAHHGVFLHSLFPDAHMFPHDCGHLGMFASLDPFIDEMLSNPKPAAAAKSL